MDERSLRNEKKHSFKQGKSRRYDSDGDSGSDLQSSDEEHRRKKHTARDREHKRHSRKKIEKDKESAKEKRKKRYRAEDTDKEQRRKRRRLLKEAKKILKIHKKIPDGATGEQENKRSKDFPHKVLSEEDYFEKNKEFSTWLKEEHGVYFSSLSSKETRKRFLDFVGAWNAGNLPKKLYEGIDTAARTSHKWEFRGGREPSIDKEEELEFMKKLEKAQRRVFRKEQEVILDELLPKATGKEKLFEKRAIRREQSRLREDSPELLREQDIMGGGDDLKQRLERERARKGKKQVEKMEALKEKQVAFAEKEAAAMDQLRALVDVAGGKLIIPKRMDPAKK